MTTAITDAIFRTNYPEFADKARFPVPQVAYYLTLAPKLINEPRWGNVFDTGVELFIAHNVALERRALDEKNGVPGMAPGIVSGKSVDKVSVNYDTQSGVMPGAGHWNLTIYGMRFIKLSRMFGAGPIQVGIGFNPPFSMGSDAWPGPWQSNFPNPS